MNEQELMSRDWVEQTGSEIWYPEKADENIMGIIIDSKEHEKYGKAWLIECDRQKMWTPYHTIFQDKMKNAKIGMLLYAIFQGVKQDNKTRDYRVWLKETNPK